MKTKRTKKKDFFETILLSGGLQTQRLNQREVLLNCHSKKEADFMVKWCVKGFLKFRKK